MDIVIFDGYTINPGDLSWSKLEKLCDRLGSLTLLFKLHKPDTLKYHRLR